MISIPQRSLIYIDFDPSKGYEIKKRRPALVMSSESYNRATNLIIVCPITSTDKKRPFLVSVHNKSLSDSSKVNTNQIFSLDYTPQANRNVEMLGQLDEETFYQVAQNVLFSFDFPF